VLAERTVAEALDQELTAAENLEECLAVVIEQIKPR